MTCRGRVLFLLRVTLLDKALLANIFFDVDTSMSPTLNVDNSTSEEVSKVSVLG